MTSFAAKMAAWSALRCLTAVLIGTLLGVGQGWLLSAMLGGTGDRSEAK
jgi:hypothetical protein